MSEPSAPPGFEETLLRHSDAAFNLARWLMPSVPDAEDVLQEAFLRAWRFSHTFRGTDVRPWLLSIVRNVCYTRLEQRRTGENATDFDENKHGIQDTDPTEELVRVAESKSVMEAVENLPRVLREVFILRELEEMSYREISILVSVPIGTVMSRLARARKRLQQSLTSVLDKEPLR
jgi:RNA polymerase sigma-70 factor (ECF subfamily)